MTEETPSLSAGRILIGPLFNEPMRLETVQPNGAAGWIVGLVGTNSERFRKVQVCLINRGGRNDYLIVEAVAPGGKILARPILNEETGITSTVNKWGVRVSNDTFEKVMADKRDNGIIERNIVGQKKRGFLDADYSMPVLGGTITNW